RINPVTPQEITAVKWVVYDDALNEITIYTGATGDTFILQNPPKAGHYYIEAYKNSSYLAKAKAGKLSVAQLSKKTAVTKVEVTEPTVVIAQWERKDGTKKLRTGYKNEVSYIHIQLKSYHNNAVDITVYSGTTALCTMTKCKANNNSTIIQEFRMTDRYKEAMQGTPNELVFKITGRDEPIRDQDTARYPINKGLCVEDKEQVRDAYFMYNGERLRAKPVAYGITVQGIVETVNMIGESLEVDVYRTQKLLYIDAAASDPKVFTQDLTVDNEGRITFDFTVESRWWRDQHLLGKQFYISVEKSKWAWFTPANIFRGSIKAYKKGDKVEGGVTPVVVEQATYTPDKKKKGRCENCDKDITVDDIKGIYKDANDTGLQEAVDFLNSQRSFFGLTTCTRKAHFLAQLATESGFTHMEERFIYNWKSLKKTFSNFKTAYDTNNTNAKTWGYGHDGKTKSQVTDENKRSIANWAYGKSPKASKLGNTPITSNWSNADADGWNYRGSGFIQLTGKNNFKKTTKLYNSWIATDASGRAKEDFVANPDKIRTDKTMAMATALIYWRHNNLVTRSDMGVGDDALGAITYRINSAFKGWAHRQTYLEEAVKILDVENCPDYTRRKGEKGTVVIIGGKGEKIINTYGHTDNVMYRLSVYRAMTLEKYNTLKDEEELPEADYVTYVTRDAHQGLSNSNRSNLRYGLNNECPPSDKYHLVSKEDSSNPLKGRYKMYVSENKNNRDINGPDGLRKGIAIHEHDRKGSQGCLTLASGNGDPGNGTLGKIPVDKLYNEIPDLFLHNIMKDAERTDDNGMVHDMSIERRPVRLILQERQATEKSNNNKPYWEGFIDDGYNT
ncbi:glycoside hydrolase family 19 protein, partial [Aquimarina longa]|uniref:glycoside hydrolase family 19 protein n=1 Tax=Aquimarina longa TaxID=1080221 RepID=UPI000ACD04B6